MLTISLHFSAANALKPAESDWTIFIFGGNPALIDEEPPFALTPCDSDLSLATYANECAAHVVEAPSKAIAALFTERNAEIEAMGIPLSQSDKDIRDRISHNDTPFLSVNDEIFFEPGRLPFEYRLAIWEEGGKMPMLMDELPLSDESPLTEESAFGVRSSNSNMTVKFAAVGDTSFTDMDMLTNEVMPALLSCSVSLDVFHVVRQRSGCVASL